MFSDTLKIPMSATPAEVRSSFLAISMTCHPDKVRANNDLNDSEKEKLKAQFLAVKSAYDTLKDSTKRREYDEDLAWKNRDRAWDMDDDNLSADDIGRSDKRFGKASNDFSAWSSGSGLPRYYERRMERKRHNWSPTVDEDENGNASGSRSSSWFHSWFKDTGPSANYGSNKSDKFSFRSFGEDLDNDIDMGGSVKNIIKVSILAWSGFLLAVGGFWLWYSTVIEANPEKLRERAARAKANNAWLHAIPPPVGVGFQDPSNTLILRSDTYNMAPRRVRRGKEPIEQVIEDGDAQEPEKSPEAGNSKRESFTGPKKFEPPEDLEPSKLNFELDPTIVKAMNTAHQRKLSAVLASAECVTNIKVINKDTTSDTHSP
jgi:curved DNA-binding protein CbpA